MYWTDLEVVDLFSYIPVKTLNMLLEVDVECVSECVTRLKQTLSRFQPEMMSFDFCAIRDLRQPLELILNNINVSMLRLLTISTSMRNAFMDVVEYSPSSRTFVLPALGEVHISDMTLSALGNILSSLNKNSFKLISVGLRKKEDVNLNAVAHRQFQFLRTVGVLSFPSVASASCSLRPGQVSFIGVFSRLVPNTQHLHFTFDLLHSQSSNPLEDEEQLLSSCRCLGAQNGNLPFPLVTSVEGVFILSNECQFVDRVRETLTDLVSLRADAGAPLLVIQDLTTGPCEPDRPNVRVFGWKVKFRAVQVDRLNLTSQE
jgi:hypothetical protein